MNKIGATKFKEKCLWILDHLDEDGYIITKHGKPLAKLLPIKNNQGDLIGILKGKLEIKGEIFSAGLKWDVES
jgi:prevent-host-death family protein